MTLDEFRKLTAGLPGTTIICIDKSENKTNEKFRLTYTLWELLEASEKTTLSKLIITEHE